MKNFNTGDYNKRNKKVLTLLRIWLEGLASKNEIGAANIDVTIPRNIRCAVSIAMVAIKTARPNIKMELPLDIKMKIPNNCPLLTFPSSSVAQEIQ